MSTVRGTINRTTGVGRPKHRTTGGKFASRDQKQKDLNAVFGPK